MRENVASLHRLVWTALLAATVAAGAFFIIHVGPVPISMQVLFVLLAGFVLGPAQGAVCLLLYLAAGALGLPVFSGGRGGLGHMMGPTGGYLLGFVLAAVLAGLATRGRGQLGWLRGAAFGGLGVLAVYAVGVPWLKVAIGADWTKALALGCWPFLPGAVLKTAGAVACYRLLYRYRLLPW
ncbi:MAG: biotin transporter BioY [Desulfovibrionaceae bacterium]